jgi:hypothetical protein
MAPFYARWVSTKLKRIAIPALIIAVVLGIGVGSALNIRHTASSAEDRAKLVDRAEAAVGADARRRVEEGTWRGPILSTRCEPTQPREKQKPVRQYRCIAVTNDTRANYSGHDYDATIDFDRDRFSFERAGA